MEVLPLEQWRSCLSSRWMREALFSMRKDEEDKRREEGGDELAGFSGIVPANS